MSNDTIPNGTVTFSMLMGRVMEVKILSSTDNYPDSWMGREYRVEYVGSKRHCLDMGQNWYAEKGMKFTTRTCNINAAVKELQGNS